MDHLILDVVASELSSMINGEETEGEESYKIRSKPTVAKHILLLMLIRWDREGTPMKNVVARYSVEKSSGENLLITIRNIIRALASYGFIVNQIACDGATENVLAIKQIDTLTAKAIFPDLRTNLPQDLPVAFPHPLFQVYLFTLVAKCRIE